MLKKSFFQRKIYLFFLFLTNVLGASVNMILKHFLLSLVKRLEIYILKLISKEFKVQTQIHKLCFFFVVVGFEPQTLHILCILPTN